MKKEIFRVHVKRGSHNQTIGFLEDNFQYGDWTYWPGFLGFFEAYVVFYVDNPKVVEFKLLFG